MNIRFARLHFLDVLPDEWQVQALGVHASLLPLPDGTRCGCTKRLVVVAPGKFKLRVSEI